MSIASPNKTNKKNKNKKTINLDDTKMVVFVVLRPFNLRTLEKNVSLLIFFILKNQIFTIMEPSKIK